MEYDFYAKVDKSSGFINDIGQIIGEYGRFEPRWFHRNGFTTMPCRDAMHRVSTITNGQNHRIQYPIPLKCFCYTILKKSSFFVK